MPKEGHNRKSVYVVFSFDTDDQRFFADVVHTDCAGSAQMIIAHVRPYAQGFDAWPLSILRDLLDHARNITQEETARRIKSYFQFLKESN